MDGLKESEAELVIYLHPSKAKSVNDAIFGELSSMLFTYNEALEGVVLVFVPLFSSNLAMILPGVEPYFGVRLSAKFLLFNPTPDMLIEGKVVKITRSGICAEVLGFAWASILDEDIRQDFKHRFVKKKRKEDANSKHEFISQTYKEHKIKVGTIIRFVVKSFDGEMLHITGSMLAENTGSSEWLDKHLDQSCPADRLTDKRTSEVPEDGKEENKTQIIDKKTNSPKSSHRANNSSKRKKEHS